MKDSLIDLISERLEKNINELRLEFSASNDITNTRFVSIDNLLPKDLAEDIYLNFPKKEQMRSISSFRESKCTFKQLDEISSKLKDITFAIQSPKIVSLIEKITGISNQRPDSSLYAGGISLMTKGDFLNPHIDNSHDGERKYYRTLNLLYYVTPDWKVDYGGNLELWDKKVKKAQILPSLFNRLIIMETNINAWHSVNPIIYDGQRCCVSNYYFSENSPDKKEYFHVTSFNGRPHQKIRRAFSKLDNLVRNGVRLFIKKGVGKHDTYTQKQ